MYKINSEPFINLVKTKPPIYNYLLKEHHSKEILDECWADISKALGGTKVKDCKAKWNCLRTSYTRYLRYEQEIITNGSKRKKWYLADCMAFLRDFIGRRQPSDDILNLTPAENYTDKKTYLEQLIKTEVLHTDEDSYHASTAASDENNSNESPVPKKAKITSADAYESISANPYDFASLEKNNTNKIATMNFFESLLPDIEKLAPRRQRKFKENVLSFLHKSIDEQESEDQE